MKNYSRILIILSVLLLVVSAVASCSGGNLTQMDKSENYDAYMDGGGYVYGDSDYYYSYDEPVAEAELAESYEYEKTASSAGMSNVKSIADTRKIIKTVSLDLETKTFDAAVESIISAATSIGGYIENSYVSGSSMNSKNVERNATFVIRVPSERLDSYVASLGETYNVLSTSTNSSDITDRYYDTEARLNSLLTQEERLLSMLEGADELQYMLQLESTLADVRYQIESYYSTLKRYDSQVSMSTINVSLREVVEYQVIKETPKSFGEEFIEAVTESWTDFGEGFLDFIIEFTYALPGLLLFAVIVTIAVIIIVNFVKKRRLKKQIIQDSKKDEKVN